MVWGKLLDMYFMKMLIFYLSTDYYTLKYGYKKF